MATAKENRDSNPSSEKYLDDDFATWLQSLMDEHHVPGLSVAVIRDGEIEASGYGLARLPDVPATADTIYVMASTTKAFSAALMGLLIEDSKKTRAKTGDKNVVDGDLTWSTPIKSILKDEFATTDSYLTDNINIEDCFSHRTGIPGHDLLWGSWLETSAASARILKHLKPNAPFRVRCQYNNIVYGLLGYAMERVTGQSFADLMRKRIFEPLDMTKTYMGVEEAREALAADKSDLQFARGYCWIKEKKDNGEESASSKEDSGYYVADQTASLIPVDPAGANMSTVVDYAKWASALLKASVEPFQGQDKNDNSNQDKEPQQLFSNELWRELTTPRAFWPTTSSPYPDITPPQPNGQVNVQTYSLGWTTDPYNYPGQVTVTHGGGIPSFGSLVYLAPNLNFGIVAAGNTAGTSNKLEEFIAKELMGRRLGVPKEERRRRHEAPNDKKSKETSSAHYNAAEPDFVQSALALSNEPKDSNKATNTSDSSSIFYTSGQPVHLPKTLTHPAYGTYNISIAPKEMSLSYPEPAHHGYPIIRTYPGLTNFKNKPNTNRHVHSIHIKPQGSRGIIHEFILHPSGHQDDKIVYDLEQLERHGLPRSDLGDEPDSFPNLPPGHGRPDDKRYPGRDTRVWTSPWIKMSGAVLVLEKGKGGDGFTLEKLGMRLARVDEPKDPKSGVLLKGWEEKMEWFTPAD